MSEPLPNIVGPHGKAWAMDLAALEAKYPNPALAGVAGWIVYAPWANIAWHYYSIECIHLRLIMGVPPPKIMLPGATHEVFVHALDPDWKLDIADRPAHLQPVNFAGQWIADNDVAAAAKIQQCVIDIVNGRLSPDTDFRTAWVQRFSDSNYKQWPRHSFGNSDEQSISE